MAMDWFHIFIQGFLLNAGLIIAIGAQNAYVLAVGLAGRHVLPIVLVSSIGDALLITIGVLIGAAGGDSIWADILSLLGALFLLWFGTRASKAVFAKSALAAAPLPKNLKAAIFTAIALSVLNPHAILDMTVIFGGVAAQLPAEHKTPFAAGGAVMSFVWFFGIGYGARLCAPWLSKPSTWRVINAVIALMMFAFAAGLLYQLYQRAAG